MRRTETAPAEAFVGALAVVAAEQVGAYTLALTFATGERRKVDFEPFLRQAAHPAIKAYLDETRFRQFQITNGNLNWNDYDLIFPVSELYAGVIR